jgi:hypothetical protein
MHGTESLRRRFLAILLITGAICLSTGDRAVLYGQSDPGISSAQPSAAATAADRLHVAVLFLIDAIGTAISRQDARVQRMCANAEDVAACKVRENRPPSAHFVRVRSAPSFTAPIAGDILIIGRGSAADWRFALVFRATADRRRRIWFRDIDWGYGPHLSGVRSRGGWIGLSGAPFDGDAWIYVGGTTNLRGEASSIAGQVLELHDVRAAGADGRTRVLPSGSYSIARVDRSGVVTFREELDIDMPCGEDVRPPAVMPPTFRAPASAFFDAGGRPRFEVKYTKGC